MTFHKNCTVGVKAAVHIHSIQSPLKQPRGLAQARLLTFHSSKAVSKRKTTAVSFQNGSSSTEREREREKRRLRISLPCDYGFDNIFLSEVSAPEVRVFGRKLGLRRQCRPQKVRLNLIKSELLHQKSEVYICCFDKIGTLIRHGVL
ncbi:hypothetical protein NMG60_11002450 [Bertholletia excelsa]